MVAEAFYVVKKKKKVMKTHILLNLGTLIILYPVTSFICFDENSFVINIREQYGFSDKFTYFDWLTQLLLDFMQHTFRD